MPATDPSLEHVTSRLFHFETNDPASELVDPAGVDPEGLVEIGAIMAALGRLRTAEQEVAEASQRYMKLGRSDMQAIHLLLVAGHQGVTITPSAIAAHVGISSASTTKLLDRLEQAGHIRRAPHPSDRRALAITVTAETRQAAMGTMGRLQAKRFHAAARLSSEERAVVARFLDDMAAQMSDRDEGWAFDATETSEL